MFKFPFFLWYVLQDFRCFNVVMSCCFLILLAVLLLICYCWIPLKCCFFVDLPTPATWFPNLNVVVLSQIVLLTVFQKLASLGAWQCTLIGIITLSSVYVTSMKTSHEQMQFYSSIWLPSPMHSWCQIYLWNANSAWYLKFDNNSAQNRSLSAPVLSTH